MPEKPVLNIRLSREVYRQLRVAAAENDFRSLNELGKHIIAEWLAGKAARGNVTVEQAQ